MLKGDSPDSPSNDPQPFVRQGQKRRREDDEERVAKWPPLPSSHFLIGENPEQFIGGEEVSHHSDVFNSEVVYDPWEPENCQWSAMYRDPYTVTYPDSAPFSPYGFAPLDQPMWQQQVQPMENREDDTQENSQHQQPVQPVTLNQAAQYFQQWSSHGGQYQNNDPAPSYDQPGTSQAQYGLPSPIFDAPPSPVLASPAKKAPEADPEFPDTEIFTEVSKSNVLSEKKVVVTLGELRRRMGAPEFQDWNIISRLTRHPATSQKAFAKKMSKYGFGSDCEQQSYGPPYSTISMLLEEDAVTLAKDFNKLLSAELSKSTLAAIASAGVEEEMAKNADDVILLLSQAKAHLMHGLRNPDAVLVDDSPDSHAVHQFSLETHYFGPHAAVAVIDSLILVVHLFKKRPFYEKNKFAPLKLRLMSAATGAAAANKTEKDSSGSAVDSSLLHPQPNDHNQFCKTLPKIAYDIELIEMSAGEIRRRAIGPEKLTASQLNAYIRKTKIINSMQELRSSLTKVGVNVNAKMAIRPSSWSLVSEHESGALARETGSALTRLPPSQAMKDAIRAFPSAAASLRQVVASLSDAMMRVGQSPTQPRVETEADMHILRFALISHHFGHTFFAYVMNWIQLTVVCDN